MPGMHAARIDTDSKPARIVRALEKANGHWVSAWVLQETIGATTAISTHVSAARKRLRDDSTRTIETRMEPNGEGGWRVYYRLVVWSGKQMELVG